MGSQRHDGMVFYAVENGRELWMEPTDFDELVKGLFRVAAKEANRLRAGLSERHREKMRAAHAILRKAMRDTPEAKDARSRARTEAQRKYFYHHQRKPRAVKPEWLAGP